jgi:hypothetical protein
MPELLSVHGRCPRCSQVLTVPAGQLQSVFRCARCQYRVLGSALLEEARLSPPRLDTREVADPRRPVAGPFEEDSDDQHTRLHLPGADGDEDGESALPAQRVGDTPSAAPPSTGAMPLQRFDVAAGDPDDQQTRLHVAGSFDAPRVPARPPPRHATLLGVPAPARLSRFGAEPDDGEDQATRFQLSDEGADASRRPAAHRGLTTRGMPAAPSPVLAPPARASRPSIAAPSSPLGSRPSFAPPPPPLAASAPLARFEPLSDEEDDQRTRLQVPVSYEASDYPPGEAALPDLHSPVAPRISAPPIEADNLAVDQHFARGTLQLSRWIDDWMRERHAVLLVTLAALSAIIAPVFDVLLGSTRQGATVIAANLALFFLWALAFAWLGRLRNDVGAWDPRVAFTRLGTGVRLALMDLTSFGALPLPLRWRVVAEVSGLVGIAGLALASALTLTHLVWWWPAGTGLLFLWRLFAGSCLVLSVISSHESWNVPAGLSPAPDVTAPAVALFPAVLDLSLPLSVPPTQASTPLHQVLEVLSQWEPSEWPNRDSYLAVLERHLMRRMGWARIERDRLLGERRVEGSAHLVVDESLLVEVVHGFDADTAERVAARMRRHARTWRGKPAVIVVFDASRAELLNGKGTPLLEALHQGYPMLAVRMPTARA